MTNKKFMSITIVLLIIVCLGLLGWINKVQKDQENLPSFADAPGKVDVKAGEFMYEKQPFLGNKDAPIKVVEFADFKCPACKKWNDLHFEQLKKEYIETGKVQYYFINFPFLAADSIKIAVAGEIIANQSIEKFWEFKEKIYKNQGSSNAIWGTEQFLLEFVKDNISGIDYDKFKSDLKANKFLFEVKEDFKLAGVNAVNGTPTIFVNGEKIEELSYENLKTSIDEQLKKAQ